MDTEAIDSDLSKIAADIKSSCTTILSDFAKLKMKLNDEDPQHEGGIAFLQLKNQMLSSYMTNLLHVQLARCQGVSLSDDRVSGSVERLVELRVVLEKMRPLENKLEYQINKLLSLAVTGKRDEDDPHQYKANPANLESQLSDSDESSSDEEETNKKSKAYVPPRNTPMFFDEENAKEKAQRRLESSRKQALGVSMLKELRQIHSDAPTEIRERSTAVREKMDKIMKEREAYEEETFTRLQVTKADKTRMKRLREESSLKDLTKFGDIRALDHTVQDYMEPSKKKRKSFEKKKSKGKGKGSKKKKFRK